MAKNFRLVLKEGAGPGQVFSLAKEEIIIGRDVACDISIIDSSVSRRHARLFLDEENYFLEDLGSTNGTMLNGEKISGPQLVEVGAEINLGGKIELLLEDSLLDADATAVFSRDMLESVVDKTRPSKVFISYSRRNKPFVEKLHAGLTERGIDTWVDWEGIPLTADWWAEIVDAIEGADGFVFVISPDSLASEICGRELEAAINQNKRLIPILHIEPEQGSNIPDQISSHNWVFMRDEEEMKSMLSKLIESINTDLGWVQAHTRLLRRATEWARREKNSSLLLQGDDLKNAEDWLAGTEENQSRPTQLQIEYIQASRRNATRRQRTITIASLAAFAITLVLAVISLISYFQADEARAEAEIQATNANIARATAVEAQDIAVTQAAIAEDAEEDARNQAATAVAAEAEANNQRVIALVARDEAEEAKNDAIRQAEKAYAGEIAATALTLLETNPQLAALLVLESQRISPEDTTGDEVLRLLPSFYPPIAKVLYNPDVEPEKIAWSSDGRLALATDHLEIQIWNIALDQVMNVLQGHEDAITSLAWSDDGRLASGDQSGVIIIWDIDSEAPEIILPNYQDGISGLAWSQLGTLASTSYDSTLVIWDLNIEDAAEIVGYPDAGLSSVAWGPLGGLVTGADDGFINVWNTATWEINFSYKLHQSGVLSVSFNEEGQLASGSKDGTVGISSIFTGQGKQMNGHTDWVNVVDWNDEGQLASASWDDTVILWNLDKEEPGRIFRGHLGAVHALDWGPDGLLASGVRYVFVWDTKSAPAMTALEGHLDWVDDLAWNEEDQLFSKSSDGTEIIWDLNSNSVLAQLENWGDGLDVSDGGLYTSGNLISDLYNQEEYFLPGYDMHFSPNGELIAGRSDGAVNEFLVWAVEPLFESGDTDELRFNLDDSLSVVALAWSPNSYVLAVGADDGSIRIWNLFTDEILEVFSEHESEIHGLAWNSENKLASVDQENRILIWDMDSQVLANELTDVHESEITSLDWSSEGWLATADDEGLIVVWDTDLAEPLTVIRSPYKRRVTAVAWNEDGSKLAFSGNSYNVYVFNTVYMQEPCTWLARNMLEWEWGEYFSDREFEQTCPNLP